MDPDRPKMFEELQEVPLISVITQSTMIATSPLGVASFGVFLVLFIQCIIVHRLLDKNSPGYLMNLIYGLVDVLNAVLALIILTWHVAVLNRWETWGVEYHNVTSVSALTAFFSFWVIFVLTYIRNSSTSLVFWEKNRWLRLPQRAGIPLVIISFILPFMLFDMCVIMNTKSTQTYFKVQLSMMNENIPGAAKGVLFFSWILAVIKCLLADKKTLGTNDVGDKYSKLAKLGRSFEPRELRMSATTPKTQIMTLLTLYWIVWICLYSWLEGTATTTGISDSVPIIFIYAIVVNQLTDAIIKYNDEKDRLIHAVPKNVELLHV